MWFSLWDYLDVTYKWGHKLMWFCLSDFLAVTCKWGHKLMWICLWDFLAVTYMCDLEVNVLVPKMVP